MSCNVFQYSRFPLKQDEKQENVEFMFPQKKPRLRREEEQHGGSVECTQRPEIRTVIAELKALEKDLRQVNQFWVKFRISESLIAMLDHSDSVFK